MKRKIAILLILGLIIAAFIMAACANDGDTPAVDKDAANAGGTPDSGAAQPQEPEQPDALEARQLVSDNLPALDFGGEEFRIVTQTFHKYDTIPETDGADVISDAVLRRNLAVEERFNIKISVYDDNYTNLNGYVRKVILSGEDTFDLLAGQAVDTSTLVLAGLMMPWQNINHVDFTQPWWSRSTTDDLTVNGQTFVAIGDFSLSALYTTYCMYFDKVQAAAYALPDIYAIAEEGKWTLDILESTIKDTYRDLNGDGQKDIGDYFGFATDPHSNLNAYLWAFDNPIMRKNSGGVPELVIMTEKISSICERLFDLLFNNPNAYSDFGYVGRHGYAAELGRDLFKDGRAMFANGTIGASITDFRGVENDYGIIPYPKWDENQERYLTMADGQHAVLAVPATAKNLNMIGAVTEALCAESWKIVHPAYYDVALKVKEARDYQSVAMLDMIVDGRIFDFGYIYDAWSLTAFCLEVIFKQGNSNFVSYWESNEARVKRHYANVLTNFGIDAD